MRGFTLVEIMIVVMIVGLLAAIAMPGFSKAREITQMTAAINDLRVFAGAFEMYSMENGAWPADRNPGQFPPEMEEYMDRDSFTSRTPIGGQYDWDPPESSSKPSGVRVGVSIRNHGLRADQVERLQEKYGDTRIQPHNQNVIFYVLVTE